MQLHWLMPMGSNAVLPLATPYDVTAGEKHLLWHHWLGCDQRHNMLKSFSPQRAECQQFPWSNSFSFYTWLASYSILLCWSYFPWCEIMHTCYVVSLKYHDGRNSWKVQSKTIGIDFGTQKPTWVEHYCSLILNMVITPPLSFLYQNYFFLCMHHVVCPSPYPLFMCHLLSWAVSVISPAQTWVGRSDGTGQSWQPARVS